MSANGSTRIPRTCQVCGTSFTVQPNVVKRGGGKYCSYPCLHKGRTTSVTLNCQVCETPFSVEARRIKKGTAKYCSRACYYTAQRDNRGTACDVCGFEFAVKPGDLKLRNYCSLACSNIGHRAHKDEWVKPLNESQREGLKLGQAYFRGKKASEYPTLARKIEAIAASRRGKPNPEHAERLRRYYAEHPEKHVCYLVGQKGHETGIERAMRMALTDAGIAFAPQYHIGRYWVDFAIPSHHLAVEVDGAYWHDAERDAVRDSNLTAMGWSVVRFSEAQVNANVSDCVAAICRLLE